MKKQRLLAILLSLLPTLALAHPGHCMENAYTGFIHPFSGWDHLLVMLAVGMWAGRLGGKARWQLPLSFVSAMTLGALMGMAGLSFTYIETAIAASVMAMGMLLLISLPLNAALRSGLIALFALTHGLAHGSELSSHSAWQALAGMVLATSLLHLAGLLLGSQHLRVGKWLHSAVGLGIVLAGGYMLMA